MQAHVGFNELDGRAGRGILLIGLLWLHGKATLDGLKVWLKIDAIQREIEKAATIQLQGLLAKKYYPSSRINIRVTGPIQTKIQDIFRGGFNH